MQGAWTDSITPWTIVSRSRHTRNQGTSGHRVCRLSHIILLIIINLPTPPGRPVQTRQVNLRRRPTIPSTKNSTLRNAIPSLAVQVSGWWCCPRGKTTGECAAARKMTGKWPAHVTCPLQYAHKIGAVLVAIRSRVEIGHNTRFRVVKWALGWADGAAGSNRDGDP